MSTNMLKDETSPYLLQHADNPVNWHPWGEEALEKAKREDKPIILSIGYSSCHWCHVMEHESFEDPETARIMNEHFVNVKVDREERPDIDAIYMEAVQAMTGSGGWPLTVFLTPQGEPFYGGTYFPPEPRHGLPSFRNLLLNVAETYRERRGQIDEFTEKMRDRLQRRSLPDMGDLNAEETLGKAVRDLGQRYDPQYGGFGTAPKFPPAMTLEFLLRAHTRTEHSSSLEMVETTLTKMARGGIFDQLGGGFHRYSVDRQWLVPHFEKMLYDNALLSRVYLHAYHLTGKDLYRRVAAETLDYVVREMTDPLGGFYSAQDADTAGEEGKYYVWTPEEIEDELGSKDAEIFSRYYGVTKEGNFEGKSVLHVPRSPEKVAEETAVSRQELMEVVKRGRRKLLETRKQRTRPSRDDKVLTAWNGLMIASFAEASWILDREDYLEAAQRNAKFVLSNLKDDNRLLRSWKDGRARFNGYLQDYSFLADGLLSLYQADFDPQWFKESEILVDEILAKFWDEENGMFYDTSEDHEELLTRPQQLEDSSVPSGSSMSAKVLLLLASYTNEEKYREAAIGALKSVAPMITRFPQAFGNWLSALDLHLGPVKEVAIIGDGDKEGNELLETVRARYNPRIVVATGTPSAEALEQVPLLRNRKRMNGEPTVYVCQQFSCKAPTTDPTALATMLDQL